MNRTNAAEGRPPTSATITIALTVVALACGLLANHMRRRHHAVEPGQDADDPSARSAANESEAGGLFGGQILGPRRGCLAGVGGPPVSGDNALVSLVWGWR